jgi:hypothetical protein
LTFPNQNAYANFEAFTAENIQAEVFWVVTPNNVVVGYPDLNQNVYVLPYLTLHAVFRPAHPPWFSHYNDMNRRLQIMKTFSA